MDAMTTTVCVLHTIDTAIERCQRHIDLATRGLPVEGLTLLGPERQRYIRIQHTLLSAFHAKRAQLVGIN